MFWFVTTATVIKGFRGFEGLENVVLNRHPFDYLKTKNFELRENTKHQDISVKLIFFKEITEEEYYKFLKNFV